MVLRTITSKLADLKYRFRNKHNSDIINDSTRNSSGLGNKPHFYTKFLDLPKQVYDKTKIKINSMPICKRMSSLLPGERLAKVDDVTINEESLFNTVSTPSETLLHRFSDLTAQTSGFFGSFPNLFHKPALTFGFKQKCKDSDSSYSLSFTNDNLYKLSKHIAPFYTKRRPSTEAIEIEEVKEEPKDTTFKDVYCHALRLASSVDLSMNLDTHLFYLLPLRVVSNVSRDHNVFVTAAHCGPLNARLYCSEQEAGSSAGLMYSLFSGNVIEATYYINRKALELSNTQTVTLGNVNCVMGVESVVNISEASKFVKEFVEEEKSFGDEDWNKWMGIAPLNIVGKVEMGKNEIMVGYMPSSKILETGGKVLFNNKDYITASFIASLENNDNIFNIGFKKELNEKVKIKMAFDSMYKLRSEWKLKVDKEIDVKINLDWNVFTGGNNIGVRVDYSK